MSNWKNALYDLVLVFASAFLAVVVAQQGNFFDFSLGYWKTALIAGAIAVSTFALQWLNGQNNRYGLPISQAKK